MNAAIAPQRPQDARTAPLSHPKGRKALRTILWGFLPVVVVATVASAIPGPIIIHNVSPSIPTGFYARSSAAPAVGRIIAFRVPEHGRLYAAAHVAPLIRDGIIKPIAAAQGDTVCTTGPSGLTINGKQLAPIVARDRRGVELPHWQGCRALRAGEYFVFSDRIPNSYDSRYYGPVKPADIIGTYRPLWLDSAPAQSTALAEEAK